MALELIPNADLVFKGPFTAVSTTTLKLANAGDERLAYKIKTTAPKRYCVKPNSGFLDARETTSVQVMLQPQIPGQDDDRSKHKFMVQWAALPNNYSDDVDNFWKNDTSKTTVKDTRLKCVFADEHVSADEAAHPSSRLETLKTPVRGSEFTSSAQATTKLETGTSSNSNQRSAINRSREINAAPDRQQESGDGSVVSRLQQELERLKQENQNLTETLRSSSGLTQRNPGGNRVGNPVIDRLKSNSHGGPGGLVLFGIPLNDRLVLAAFVIALFFGFSLGYFLFSCGN